MKNIYSSTCFQKRHRRDAFGIAEMVIALLLLGMMVSYIVPLFHQLGTMQRRIEKQTLLQQTAVNLIEELHTFSATQIEDIDAISKILKKQIDTDKYNLTLQKHPPIKTGQPLRVDLELRPIHQKETLTAVKLSTWLSLEPVAKEAS